MSSTIEAELGWRPSSTGSGVRFVDTNVLLYACSSEEPTAEIARRVMRDRALSLSAQVLAEFYYQATRPTRQDALSHDQAVAFVERLSSRRGATDHRIHRPRGHGDA